MLLIVLLVGTAVRFYRIAEPSYTYDEGFTAKLLTFSPSDALERIRLDNSHPPLYYYLVRCWCLLFGCSPGSLRSMSAAAGVSSIFAAYLLAAELCRTAMRDSRLRAGSAMAGLLAASLMALSPVQIEWSQQARMYAPGIALSLFATYYLLRALSGQVSAWFLYVVFAVALAYTHYFAILIVVGHFIYGVCQAALRQRGKSKHCQSGAGLIDVTLVFGVVFLAFLPWLPTFFAQSAAVVENFWTRPFRYAHIGDVCGYLLGGPCLSGRHSDMVSILATAFVIGPAVAMAAAGNSGARVVGVIVLITGFGAVAVSVLERNLMVGRYFVFAHSLFLCGVAAALPQATPRRLRIVGSALVIGGAAVVFCRYVGYREWCIQQPGMAGAVAVMRGRLADDDLVLVSNPMVQIVVSGHCPQLSKVRVLSDNNDFPFFQGQACMRSGEYMTYEDLALCSQERVWTVNVINWIAGTSLVRMPVGWRKVEEVRFREWIRSDCRVLAACYERESPDSFR